MGSACRPGQRLAAKPEGKTGRRPGFAVGETWSLRARRSARGTATLGACPRARARARRGRHHPPSPGRPHRTGTMGLAWPCVHHGPAPTPESRTHAATCRLETGTSAPGTAQTGRGR